MKLLLLITLIGIEATSCNFLKFSFARNQDSEDELENLDYPQPRQDGGDERDPAAWELWDRQNDESEIKDTENTDSLEGDKTNDGFEKPVQSAVKRESASSGDKYHSILQIEPLVGDVNKNTGGKKEDSSQRLSNKNDKKSGTRSPGRSCKTHTPRSCPPHTHTRTTTCQTHHTSSAPHRTTNCTRTTSHTTTEATETILVQEPFKLDSNEVYSVCDMDGNWSWPLSTNDSKKWLRWLWVLPCLLLGILLLLLFVRTFQNYAEQRAFYGGGGGGGRGGNETKVRSKMCQQRYQDPCRDPHMNATSPLIRKLEPRRYQSPAPADSVVGQGMRYMKGQPPPNQSSQMGVPMSQMGTQASQRGLQINQMNQMKGEMQRKHSINPGCPPIGLRPQRMPSAMPRTGKTQKLVFIRSPQPYAMPRKPSYPCPRPQPQYYGPPPPSHQNMQTHLQQQCLPSGQLQHQQQITSGYSEARVTSGHPHSMFCSPPSPRKTRARSPHPFVPRPPQSPPRECSSRSPSPKPNQNS